MNNRHTPLWFSASLLIIFAIWLTACGGAAPAEEPAVPEAPAEEPAAPEYIFPPPIEGEFFCYEESEMICAIRDDIEVHIPLQEEFGTFLYAVNLPMGGDLEDFRNEERDEFIPHRLAINFEIVIDPAYPDDFISSFAPPIYFRIRYYEEDAIAVGGFEYIQMGFWDEENEYWVSFAQHDKYNFYIDGDDSGGYIWVTIYSWGDRRIGFG